MGAAHAQAFLRRPWDYLAALEREHWAREFARRGPAATLEVSRLLWEHMRRVRPDWPSRVERRELEAVAGRVLDLGQETVR